MSDELENRKAKYDYLKTWLDNFSQAQDIVPHVQNELEKTDWEIEALSNMPDEASEIPLGNITVLFNEDLRFLNRALPMIPTFDPSTFSSSDAISTSGTASVYEYISRIGDINTPRAYEFSEHFTLKYQEIQSAQNRPNEIRKLLEKLPGKNTLDRFDRAENIYSQFKAGVGEKTSAAMEMRNFLYGLVGDLAQFAKQWEKENTPSWEKIAERLSKNGTSGLEYQEMLRQKNVHSSLIGRLSSVGKDREGSSVTNLNHIWTELLDHVFTILNIINL